MITVSERTENRLTITLNPGPKIAYILIGLILVIVGTWGLTQGSWNNEQGVATLAVMALGGLYLALWESRTTWLIFDRSNNTFERSTRTVIPGVTFASKIPLQNIEQIQAPYESKVSAQREFRPKLIVTGSKPIRIHVNLLERQRADKIITLVRPVEEFMSFPTSEIKKR